VPEIPLSQVGLCAQCRHAQRVPAPRTTYWLCRLAAVDPRFERYPRLPIRECVGHEPADPVQIERSDTPR
jgi:hypothetical protein